ncbi:MAG TPA: leucyl aminopeptidase family protein [Nocardioidaceae bacterium]|nr:leucyl aminopeptidase family protein [Nocardioidaceae bacterium]
MPVGLPSQVSPPQVALSDAPPSGVVGAEVVALPVLPADHGPADLSAGDSAGVSPDESGGVSLGPGAAALLDQLDLDVFGLLEHAGATGRAGEIVRQPVLDPPADNPALRCVILVGVGAASPADLRRAGAALARSTKGRTVLSTSVAALADDAGLRAFVDGLVLGSFGFHRRSAGPVEVPVERVVLASIADAATRQGVLERALAVAGAGWFARTLALVPSNEKNPQWMAERAGEVADQSGLEITVWDEDALARDGFGGILGVGRASATPPRLVRLDYRPRGLGQAAGKTGARGAATERHVVLVGKGITFDTGGLSLKPADAMMNMKRDMTGAGVVMAVMGALADVECPVRVTALLACAENAVSGDALRPGDVLRHYGGRTTEVTNTDAEGRLVMADALAYAVDQIRPDLLVDVATLTGAMKIALGLRTGGMFTTHDGLADTLVAAGQAAGEPLWRMPLAEDYQERLESTVADSDNAAGGPGAITAALFLKPFTGGLPWAHLDIASVGDSPVDAYEWTMGATGFGARALLHWLELQDPLAGVGPVPSTTG